MKNKASSRDASLDLIRILSAYLVIICHTIIYIRLDELTPLTRYFTFYLQSFSKIAVPLFLMISGCTLLSKTDTIQKTIGRVLRIIVVLLLFSLVYEFLHRGSDALSSFSFTSFLDSIYRNPIIVPYWYLYTYAGLLLMVPLLQKLVRNMTKK